jgi:hypothetical protein
MKIKINKTNIEIPVFIIEEEPTFREQIGVNLLNDADIKKILDAMIASGRRYSKAQKSKPHLLYEWHDSEYLGAVSQQISH